jgi:hypothetical protein
MILQWNLMLISYSILCLAILLLGYRAYKRRGDTLALNIGLAFGIFGITYSVVLLGYFEWMLTWLAGLRWLAYLMIVLALYKAVPKK